MNCQISADSNDAATREAKKPKLPNLLPYPPFRPFRLTAGLNSDSIHRAADGRSSRVARRLLGTKSLALAPDRNCSCYQEDTERGNGGWNPALLFGDWKAPLFRLRLFPFRVIS